jgi:hypothetical protein
MTDYATHYHHGHDDRHIRQVVAANYIDSGAILIRHGVSVVGIRFHLME